MEVKTRQMESVRLKINEHMTSVGEEILCVLDQHSGVDDLCQLKLHVRVFVLERLRAAAVFMCNLFQREMETLGTLLEELDADLHTADFLHVTVCKEEVTSDEERSSSPVQEEPQPPQIKEEQEELLQRPEEAGGSTVTLLAVKSEADNDDENGGTEPVAGTSTEHMKTQAYVEYWVRSQQTGDDQLLSSHCDEWKETRRDQSDLNTHNVGGQCMLSQDLLQSPQQTDSMKSHTGTKCFTCTECGKMFNQKGNLNKHMMTHTGEKPFSCIVCGTGFTQMGNLKIHLRTHTGEKPYACTVCGRGCVNTSHLKRHMRTHTGEKPLSCAVCGKSFAETGTLKRHMRTHSAGKPFSCTVCGKGCRDTSDLKRHIQTHALQGVKGESLNLVQDGGNDKDSKDEESHNLTNVT